MALQLVYVDDTAPGATGNAGIVFDGTGSYTTDNTINGSEIVLTGNLDSDSINTNDLVVMQSTILNGTVQINGSFTSGSTKFTIDSTTGDIYSAGTIDIDGIATFNNSIVSLGSLSLSADSNFSVNTNRFTIDAATGDTTTLGNLIVNGTISSNNGFVSSKGIDCNGDIDVNNSNVTIVGTTGNITTIGSLEVGTNLTVTGNTSLSSALSLGATDHNATSGNVVLELTSLYEGFTTNNAAPINATLADGLQGQLKIIRLNTFHTSNLIVTPANTNGGYSNITMTASGNYAILIFVGTGWTVVDAYATLA